MIIQRKLPIQGKIIVNIGNKVSAEETIAEYNKPGKVQSINILEQLDIDPEDIKKCLIKKQGDAVKSNEIIGETKGLFGYLKKQIRSPFNGHILSISFSDGKMIIKEDLKIISLNAYVNGVVKSIYDNNTIFIESNIIIINGIYGLGTETIGALALFTNTSNPDSFRDFCIEKGKNKIIIVPAYISYPMYKTALELNIKGIITGSCSFNDLLKISNCKSVISSSSAVNTTMPLIITEGFGNMPINHQVFKSLCLYENYLVSMNGTTQIRAGIVRPQILISKFISSESDELPIENNKNLFTNSRIEIGSKVRMIREPFFGKTGKIIRIPRLKQKLESEIEVNCVEVQLDSNVNIITAKTNIELL